MPCQILICVPFRRLDEITKKLVSTFYNAIVYQPSESLARIFHIMVGRSCRFAVIFGRRGRRNNTGIGPHCAVCPTDKLGASFASL